MPAHYPQDLYLSIKNSPDFHLLKGRRTSIAGGLLFAEVPLRGLLFQHPIAFPPHYSPPKKKALNRILNQNHRGFPEAHTQLLNLAFSQEPDLGNRFHA